MPDPRVQTNTAAAGTVRTQGPTTIERARRSLPCGVLFDCIAEMAVLLETSLGEIVIDLHTDLAPKTCKNFLKLCKVKYYNNVLFHKVQNDFMIQTGDPTGTGRGGESIYGKLYGNQARFIEDEVTKALRHEKV